ncbi:MAG: hypothetical protein ABIQ30_17655 [Devosia sp.]
MPKLLDFLSFKDTSSVSKPVPVRREDTLRKDERDAAVLAGKYPHDGADIESASEYRLASLMQYPHY